jgi:hypothetical protein
VEIFWIAVFWKDVGMYDIRLGYTALFHKEGGRVSVSVRCAIKEALCS